MGKGDTDRGHSRENYYDIFHEDLCKCDECRAMKEYGKRVTGFKGDKHKGGMYLPKGFIPPHYVEVDVDEK